MQKTVEEAEQDAYKDVVVIKAVWSGRHKSVMTEKEFEESSMEMREDSTGIGTNNTEYPIERDDYTLHRYTGFMDGQSYGIFKKLEIEATEEKQEIRELVEKMRRLPELEEKIRELSSYEEMKSNKELVREYQEVYQTVQNVWHKDSLSKYRKASEPPALEFERHPRAGYGATPRLYSEHLNELIGEELEKRELGGNSEVWGRFFFSSKFSQPLFNEMFKVLKPFYTTSTGGD